MKRILAGLFLGSFLGVSFLTPPFSEAAEKVVLGFTPSLTSALDIIADKQGFFTQEGLQTELREYSRGSTVMQALFAGEIDLGSSAGFTLVSSSFTRTDFKIVGDIIVVSNDNKIVARKDRGIRVLSDLKGKRVGSLKGMPWYSLDLFLLQNGLTGKDITLVLVEDPVPLVGQLSSGELDAICVFGAWIDKAARALGDNVVFFSDDSLMRITTFMAAMTSRLQQNPGLFEKVLRAYLRAEEYIHAQPERSLEIVCDRLKLDLESFRQQWKPNFFRVALDQSIMESLEDVARWQIKKGLQKTSDIPNYLDFLWFPTLQGIDPKRISIVH